jgi:mRNA interferase MazF
VKRGDIVTVALQGEVGKPRPALVIQDDAFAGAATVVVLPMTSDSAEVKSVRISVTPTSENGLRMLSHVMVDKIRAIPRDKVGASFGQIDAATMGRVEIALIELLGLNQR